jgi:hypothetical protein
MKTEFVHSYITGRTFANICGGYSDDYSASITHIKYLTSLAEQRWPWLKNKWSLSDGANRNEYYNTLRAAKQRAQELWPGCGFKTPAQFRKEAKVPR